MPPITLDGSLGITTPTYGGADTSEYLVPVTAFKNKIINGQMQIDQRNAGASVAGNGVYTLDRWLANTNTTNKFNVQQNAGSVTPPTGFINYLGVTSSSAYTIAAGEYSGMVQSIEGLNCADLNWGTANAQTVTLSFWVRSSLTGTFGGALRNSAGNRCYPFSYTISSANTWEQKSVTIAGDTTGTWLTTNGIGIQVWISLGAGSTFSGTAGSWTASNVVQPTGSTSVLATNGATFYLTGVQLERGSTATSFDYRPYGTELALCQRYCYTQRGNNGTRLGFGYCGTTTLFNLVVPLPVTMRTAPTLTSCSPVDVNDNQAAYSSSSITIGDSISETCVNLKVTTSGLTAGRGAQAYFNASNGLMLLSSEL